MRCYVGIDLGSTTTKSVIIDDQMNIIGRGITNSRSNYDVACEVAKTEAYVDARFSILKSACHDLANRDEIFHTLESAFRLEQYLEQLKHFIVFLYEQSKQEKYQAYKTDVHHFIEQLQMKAEAYGIDLYMIKDNVKSDFFRDIISVCYNDLAASFSKEKLISFDLLLSLYDKAIIDVENAELDLGYEGLIRAAYKRFFSAEKANTKLFAAIEDSIKIELNETCAVGTGYGRQRLPFPKEQIRSEILCHGLGAHYMFPKTRTVLDIGGQDTKAIQIDEKGIVTNFQMNDRCAAGCGRYLGYIAEEMNLALQELGPMALTAEKAVKINSTCTVFAGAELRDKLSDGLKREEILLGLHKAIMFRAMSLLARSGGIINEFTFTGGVAKNEAATKALRELVEENYGKDIIINIAADSIFTGAIGAAIFAYREINEKIEKVEVA